MTNHICWITDYVADECQQRACTHSPSLFHPCIPLADLCPYQAADAAGEVGDDA